jgi:hypothetical protein
MMRELMEQRNMGNSDTPRKYLAPLDRKRLESRLHEITQKYFGEATFNEMEMRYLSGLASNPFLLLADFYHEPTVHQILNPDLHSTVDFLQRIWKEKRRNEDPSVAWLRRVRAFPEEVRLVGDKCLYDVGLFGKQAHGSYNLQNLGMASYNRASEILDGLSQDPRLCEFFRDNRVDVRRIQEEIQFLRQCASKFPHYAQVLAHLHLFGEGPDRSAWESFEGLTTTTGLTTTADLSTTDDSERDDTRTENTSPLEDSAPASPAHAPLRDLPEPAVPASLRHLEPSEEMQEARDPETAKLSHQELLSFYERLLLFSNLNITSLRDNLKDVVIDQQEAIDSVCDDFSLFATGTHSRRKPLSYFFIGPTGVGKNLLIERLVEALEALWGLEVPLLLIEGPSYTYPSDINELRGSTRGFIRSDEEGLLTEFHHRAAAAPFSVILVDEVEKAHAQLRKYFLSIMDRGTTIDNRGQELNFSSTLLVYTSNLGYSDLQQSSDPIGFGDSDSRANYERCALMGDLKKELSPEFINRTRIMHFKSLSERSIQKIFDLEMEKIAQRYRRVHGLELSVSPAARQALITQGFSHEYGARHLSRVLNQVCNVGVSKKLRHDSVRETQDQESRGLLAYIAEARKEERITDLDMLHRKVMQRTRAKVAYLQVNVDFVDGKFHYVTE